MLKFIKHDKVIYIEKTNIPIYKKINNYYYFCY